jgi:hypothetical protein
VEIGKYTDGRSVGYDQETGQFDVGGAPVTVHDVIAYDGAGQLTWASAETRQWAYQHAAGASLASAPSVKKTGWFSGLPTWGKVLFVIFYPISIPYGIVVMWKDKRFSAPIRVVLTGAAAFFLIVAVSIATANDSSTTASAPPAATSSTTAPPTTTPTQQEQAPPAETVVKPEPAPKPGPAAQPVAPEPEPAAPSMTMGQEQAVGKAQDYLAMSGFSRKGLINQLVYEGFSKADATFGVDYIKPNWNKQAAKKAQDYIDMSSFSRQGLIDQLVYEGFTQAQAKYGVKAVGY